MTSKTYEIGGHEINRLGYGAMQLPGPGVWGPPADREVAIAVLRRAVELGVNHLDTAQFYGPGVANELIRDALHPYEEELFIATKVGARRGDAPRPWRWALRPEEVREDVDANLRALGVEHIDLVNLRVIPTDSPMVADGSAAETLEFEELIGVLVELRDAGKIGHVGLSAVNLEELEAALALTDIACVQNHYNILEREDQDIFEACAARGLAFVPYWPLGSAMNGGPAKLASDPTLTAVAERHDATPAQIALAWLLHSGDNVLLIPGTSSIAHLEENAAAADIELTAEDMALLDAAA